MIDDRVPQSDTGGRSAGTLSDDLAAACVQAATAAPSLHNSQPWRFRIRDGGIDVFADRHRQLEVIDPSGRELLISVGAAIFNLRLAMRQHGRLPTLTLFPEPAAPTGTAEPTGPAETQLVARIVPGRAADPSPGIESLAAAIPRRHTNRWPFAPSVVPADVIEGLTAAARHEGADLAVASAVGRNAILSLSHTAEQRQRASGAYRAELARWSVPRPGRHEGIPASAIGPWDALETLPIRDFGLAAPQLHRSTERFEPFPTILVLATDGDSDRHWVTAGQALQRVLLLATAQNLATTPISQPLEIPAIRQLLTDTDSGRWAQMIVRVGYGPPAAATGRRPLAEVLIDRP